MGIKRRLENLFLIVENMTKSFYIFMDHIFEFPRLGLVGGSVLKMAHGSKGNKSSLNSYVYWDILNYIRQL